MIKRTASRLKVNGQVNIALLVGLSLRDETEDAYVVCATLGTYHLYDFLTSGFLKRLKCHSPVLRFWYRIIA